MDFIALWIYLENRKSSSSLNETFIKKVENLENACKNISESIDTVSSVLNLEEKFNRQREDITFTLEKINEKNRDLEERLNTFAQFLLSSIKDKKEEDAKESLETY